MIPYSTQTIDEDDREAVLEVLSSPFLTTGPVLPEFEEAAAGYLDAGHCVAVSSGTAALHLAVLALGIRPGDRVWVSAVSFVASANCALYAGAAVDFVDVDTYGNLSLEALEDKLREAQRLRELPRLVIAVHLSGRPVDLERLAALKEKYGFYVIEDACHALGARYRGAPIGSCRCADITVFSLHPVKIITSGEGGLCTTNDARLAHTLKILSSHGIERDRERLERRDEPGYYYEMRALGFNYRLTEIQAALGLSQLGKVEDFLKLRRQKARDYFSLLADSPDLGLPLPDTEDNVSSWHLFQVRVPDRDRIYESLRARKIGVQIHYLPIYRHPYYQRLRPYPALRGAEEFFRQTLSIPLFPRLTALEQQLVAATLKALLDK